MLQICTRFFLSAALGALLILMPNQGVRAVGLGEARVESWLGQPLDVRVQLVEAEPADLESLEVIPASLDDHQRLGVPSEALALGLEMAVDDTGDGAVLRIRSRRNAEDPIIRVLVDARWSGGRVLREYTLFLDPPSVDQAPPPAQPSRPEGVADEQPAEAEERSRPSQPTRERAAPARRSEAPPAETERAREPAAAEPDPAPAGGTGAEVAVNPGDTLWSIAYDWRPDDSLSMSQVLAAILENNPDAFIDNDVNRLRRDVSLVMPAVEQVRAVSAEQAEQRIRSQIRAWQQRPRDESVATVDDEAVAETRPQAETTAPTGEPAGETEEESPEEAAESDARLDIVPPESEDADSGVAEEERLRLRDAVDRVEEEMYLGELESDELEAQIDDLRAALDSDGPVSVSMVEDDLAYLQAELREARRARAEERMATARQRAAGEDEDEPAADDAQPAVDTGSLDRLQEEFAEADEAEPEPGADEPSAEATDEADEAEPIVAEDDPASAADDADIAGDDEEAGTDEMVPPVDDTPAAAEGQGWLGRLASLPWLMIAAVAVIVLLLGWWWQRRRAAAVAGEDETVEAAPVREREAGVHRGESRSRDSEAGARAAVEADPDNLAAHLGLLQQLAEREEVDTDEFGDRLDVMFQHVTDESDGHWQEALTLAARHVPEHPLLTPAEAPPPEEPEADLEDRTEQMLGMLDSWSGEDEPEAGGEDGEPQPAGEREEQELPDWQTEEEGDMEPPPLDELGGEMDTGAASEPVEEASLAEEPETGSGEPGEDDLDLDFDFESLDESASEEAETAPEPESGAEPDQAPEPGAGSEQESEPEPDFELDFDADTGAEPEPGREPAEESGAQSGLDLDSESGSEAASEAEAESVPEPESGPEQDAAPGFDLDLDTGAEPEPDDAEAGREEAFDLDAGDAAGTDSEAEPAPDTGPEPEPESEPDLDLDLDAGAEPEPESEPEPADETGEEPAPAGDDNQAAVSLDLAEAYIQIQDNDSARALLEEVLESGDESARERARKLLDQL